jgi:outer membrane lipoprotein carrier protein
MQRHLRFKKHLFSVNALLKLWILLFFVIFPADVLQAEPLSLEQLIARMQESYDKTKDMEARFIQEVTIKSINKTEREEGIVYFKNPQRMLWNYLQPKPKKMIINPEKVWLYIPEDRIVYIQEAKSVFESKLTIKFLSGIGKLTDEFQVRFSHANPVNKEGNYLLTLLPKDTDLGIEKLFVTANKDTLQIEECSFTDALGNITRIRFKIIKTNANLSDKLFTFKVPAGVEVVNID